jgi:hypothetical protein
MEALKYPLTPALPRREREKIMSLARFHSYPRCPVKRLYSCV